ncbi:disease resistance protein RGA5-like [Triticum dicoccoides]|uniref:disease resistance protein RGA5-like n=1 Tax=Triticum dicoccoides TaxID=85692 RepID=UPI00189175B7|nr:disease resistance protein RGA5-like [Triticum dicoccoides]
MQGATAALIPLLRKLGELAVAEFTLDKRVKKRVESLREELDMMHAVLHDLGDVPAEQLKPPVRIWAAKVRELSYNMEDAVDTYMVRLHHDSHGDVGPNNMKNRVKKFIKRTKNLFSNGKALHQISGAVQDAQRRAKVLGDLRKRYMLEEHTKGEGNTIDPRLKAVYKDVTELVGIEGIRDQLIQKLLHGDDMSSKQLKTLSIVGFGGLGKTTLTKAVYDKIIVKFDCGVFLPVSRNPNITSIFKKMLYDLDKITFKDINESAKDNQQLINELRAFLQDRRYLIVIDDIWDEEAWEIIKCAFSRSDLGSRVITTTRINSVSKACCPFSGDIIHEMKSLDDDDSKSLFHKRIFSQGSECPVELEEVSREILKKCDGVPLAIITIASLLASNDQHIRPKYEWDKVLSSIGRGLAEGRTAKDMEIILSFSYYDLPSHLKTCFLYLSIFPEDHWIDRSGLIWRWIAEGFIRGGHQEISLFEVGETYYSELINRNLIQPIYSDAEFRAEGCRVHDMVLDLICSLSSEENFVTIWDGSKHNKNNSDSMVRRLSFQNSMSELTTHQVDATSMSKLRSVTLFRTDDNLIRSLSSLQLLRVLDLSGCDLWKNSYQIDLRCVEKLLHLRYLGLQGTLVDALPIEIGKLQFLQTLDFRFVVGESIGLQLQSLEVPSSVVRLGNLMCLYVYENTRLPVGIDNLVSLEELSVVTVDGTNAIEKELGKLVKLRVLRILWEGDDESVCNSLLTSLANLQNLRTLEIYHDGNARFDANCDGWVPPPRLHALWFDSCTSTLPRWMNSSLLPVLSYLLIEVDRVRPEVDIQILGKLPALCFLNLNTTRAQYTPVKRFIIGHDAFPCLRECILYNFQTGPSMFPRGSMPRLEYIDFCARASHITGGDLDVDVRHLPSLHKVTVRLWSEVDCLAAVQKAADMLNKALDVHPNHPALHHWFEEALPEELVQAKEPAAAITVSDRGGEAVVM